MATICDEVAKLTSGIRNMLRESDTIKTYEVTVPGGGKLTRTGKLNQTAAIDDKITNVKESPGEWHRTPKGKPVIYTSQEPFLEPRARDIIEMAEHDRPYMCRAVKMFAKDEVACYTPSSYFQFIKDNLKSINESKERLDTIIQKKWGADKPQTDAEKALMETIESRRKSLRDILEPIPEESIMDSYGVKHVTPAKIGFASYAVTKCAFTLK